MNLAAIDFSNIFSWFVFGLIAGYVAHLIDPAEVFGGLLGTAIMGIAGAILGGAISYSLFGITVTGFNLESLIIAAVGALAFSFLYRLLFRREEGVRSNQYGYKGGRAQRRK